MKMSRLSSFCRQTTSGVPPGIPPGCHDGRFIRRFSYRACIFVSDHDRPQILQYDRNDFDLVSELELKTGTVTPDSALIQMIGASHSDEIERQINLALFSSATAPGC
jgi:hypothetical protein